MSLKKIQLKGVNDAPAKKKGRRTGRDEIIGEVVYHRAFSSASMLRPRDIMVWLPPSYRLSPWHRFPVLYMHDGQNVFDPHTAYAGADWRVDEAVVKLVKENLIDEVIVVGVYNTSDRLEEYSDSETGSRYLRFLTSELKPFIDSEYHTMPGAANTAVMGSSMGGLCSFNLAWKHPEVFGKAACLSSSFYYGNEKVFRAVARYSGVKKNIKLYIDCGEDGKRDAQRMFCALTDKGFTLGADLDFVYDAGAQHTETAWAKRLERPLRFLFGKHAPKW